MEKYGLNPGDVITCVFGFVQQGDGDVGGGHACFAEIAQGRVECLAHFGGKGVKKKLTRNAQTNLSGVNAQSCRFREVRLPTDAKIERSSQDGGVADGASQRAGAIERGREWDDAFTRDTAPGGLEANDATEGSGDADGAARVRADAAVAKARGDCGGGTSAGAAWDAFEIPGIADGPEVGIVGCDAVGELVHVGLAEQDRARLFKLCDDWCIVFGNKIL